MAGGDGENPLWGSLGNSLQQVRVGKEEYHRHAALAMSEPWCRCRRVKKEGYGAHGRALELFVRVMFSGDDNDTYAFEYGDEADHRELVEAYLVELDPALDGFGPVIVELYAIGAGDGREGYEVRQTATATANRLLAFTTKSEALARAVYEGEPSVASLVRYSPARMV